MQPSLQETSPQRRLYSPRQEPYDMEETEKTSNTSEYLKGIVLNLPEGPGIYQYLNKEGVIIYVGKAKNLKRRVYSYFSKDHQSAKTRMLVSKIADIR